MSTSRHGIQLYRRRHIFTLTLTLTRVSLRHDRFQFTHHHPTEQVHVRRPQRGREIHQSDPNEDANGHDPRRSSRNPVRVHGLPVVVVDGVTVAVDDLAVPRLARDAVEHPAEHGAEQSAVEQVDGETLLPEPGEEAPGEDLPRCRGDVDG